MSTINSFTNLTTADIARAAQMYGTPFYLYDETFIKSRCREFLNMPSAFDFGVRYAVKANPCRSVLKLIAAEGLLFDASSLNEVTRTHLAGIEYEKIMLTSQETYSGDTMQLLQENLLAGLKYNVCSLNQLMQIGDFASANKIDIGLRIHPGIGTGESATRTVGDDYSCFGIHSSDWKQALSYAEEKGLKFRHIHVHIGSGGDMDIWRQSIDIELDIIENHFPHAESLSFGGGLKEARMPDELSANLTELGNYAKDKLTDFYKRTGRKLKSEIEPGSYIVANAGYAVTKVIDMKKTRRASFIILDGGMELNSRPLLYGSKHPFYIVSKDGRALISSEFDNTNHNFKAVVAGKCCESGDCQTLAIDGRAITRTMNRPNIGDFVLIGGVGAYCSSMAPFNYNSHTQAPEVISAGNGDFKLARRRQTIEQLLQNEV